MKSLQNCLLIERINEKINKTESIGGNLKKTVWFTQCHVSTETQQTGTSGYSVRREAMSEFLMLLKSLSPKILNINNIYPQQIQDTSRLQSN